MPFLSSRLMAAVFVTMAGSLVHSPIGRAAPPSGSIPTRSVPPGFVRAEAGGIKVEQAWARASAGNVSTGAAYVTLTGGDQLDSLVGASTPVAATAEVHESFTDNGVMKMRPVTPLPIPAGKTVTFAPGGYHVMLMGVKKPLEAGQSFPLTLRFEHAQPITVDVQVRALGHAAAMTVPMNGQDHMHMQ